MTAFNIIDEGSSRLSRWAFAALTVGLGLMILWIISSFLDVQCRWRGHALGLTAGVIEYRTELQHVLDDGVRVTARNRPLFHRVFVPSWTGRKTGHHVPLVEMPILGPAAIFLAFALAANAALGKKASTRRGWRSFFWNFVMCGAIASASASLMFVFSMMGMSGPYVVTGVTFVEIAAVAIVGLTCGYRSALAWGVATSGTITFISVFARAQSHQVGSPGITSPELEMWSALVIPMVVLSFSTAYFAGQWRVALKGACNTSRFCASCGYDLRGLSRLTCPECGTDIPLDG